MPHPDFEDITEFFDPDEFATTAHITRGAENIGDVLGIFDDPNEVARIGEYSMDHVTPKFECAEVDVADVHKNDRVTIEGREFDLMEEPQLDGTGTARLVLGKTTVTYNAGL